MGRGRGGKGKKQTIMASNDNAEEEKLPPLANKRRGRPQKPFKNQAEDDQEAEKIEEDEDPTMVGIGKARKRKKRAQENRDAIEEANESGEAKHSSDSNGSFVKSAGFRPSGSRRKSKPCRAAEVGVEC